METQAITDNLMTQSRPPQEGRMTKQIEAVTSKIPSGSYLSLALGSMALSAALAAFSRRKNMANFVGLWVPTLMLVGIYNKLVKVEGSDQMSHNRQQNNLH